MELQGGLKLWTTVQPRSSRHGRKGGIEAAWREDPCLHDLEHLRILPKCGGDVLAVAEHVDGASEIILQIQLIDEV